MLNIFVKHVNRNAIKVIRFIAEHEGQMKVLINTRRKKKYSAFKMLDQ